MMTQMAVGTNEWVERARGLAPIVKEWRDAAEEERHVPRPLFEALRGADMFRLSTPRSLRARGRRWT